MKKEIKRMLDSINKEKFWRMGAYSIDGNVHLHADHHGGSTPETVYNATYDVYVDLTGLIKDWLSGEQTKANILNYIYEDIKDMEDVGPGRPALPRGDKRSPRSIKMSDDEWEKIKDLAKREGLSASEYVRIKALGE